MGAPSQIKELRGGVQVVRRTSNSADWPQKNRLRISRGRRRDCGKGPFLDRNYL